MTSQQFTSDDLWRILIASAGTTEGVDLGQDIVDVAFKDLGYDSIALMETGSRIEREFGISLNDSDVMDARAPRELIAMVNAQLAVSSGASA